MGRLVQHQCTGQKSHAGKKGAPFSLPGRRESRKGEAVAGQTGAGEGGNGCTCAGDRHHRDAFCYGVTHQVVPRVRNAGSACIGDQRHGSPLPQGVQDTLTLELLVVVEIGGQRFGYVEVIEQFQRMACIFGGDQIHLAQDPYCPIGDVLQVADGSCNYVEGGGHYFKLEMYARTPSKIPSAVKSRKAGSFNRASSCALLRKAVSTRMLGMVAPTRT